MARKGILGTKLGMTQVFDDNNRVVPVTVVKAGPNVVTRIRTTEQDGYSAVQLAYGEISPRKVTKPVTGQFAAAGINPVVASINMPMATSARLHAAIAWKVLMWL
ncbi:50S ribosomal protein L3 rplC [Mycobacteroides abscessus]|nr:50S ribosomal protein L3 rplC [Mycobacteroides abscessus]